MTNTKTTVSRHATLALEWWRDCRTDAGIPFHAVARGLRLSYTALRVLLAEQHMMIRPLADDTQGAIATGDAYRLHASMFGR